MLAKRAGLSLIPFIIAVTFAGDASAASAQVENYCWAKASRIWFNGRGDREQFIANCIADLTPPPAQRSRNRVPQ